jgi:hypothetical protein
MENLNKDLIALKAAFASEFDEAVAEGVFSAATVFLAAEMHKAEQRKVYEGLENEEVQAKIAADKVAAIEAMQAAAVAELEARLGGVVPVVDEPTTEGDADIVEEVAAEKPKKATK